MRRCGVDAVPGGDLRVALSDIMEITARYGKKTLMRRKVKVVSIQYGLLGNPNNRRIERAIEKWTDRGWALESQIENPSGCFCLRYAGKTRLTFIRMP
jgi:hypothetical protein